MLSRFRSLAGNGAGQDASALDAEDPAQAIAALTRSLRQAEAEIRQLRAKLRQAKANGPAAAYPNVVFLGDHEALVRLHSGHKIYVDTRDVGIASHLMMGGRWETWVEAVLARLVKPGMVFCDIGAHFGYYTLLGADWVGERGRVHAFEANPGLFRKLRKSVLVNGFGERVEAHELALSDAEGSLDLHFSDEFSGGGNVFHGGDPYWSPRSMRVKAAPLDAVLGQVPAVQVMKLDVEGMEPQVLEGGRKLIDRSADLALVLEFSEDAVGRVTEPCGYLESLEGRWFRLYAIEPRGLSARLSARECLAAFGGRLGYLLLLRGEMNA